MSSLPLLAEAKSAAQQQQLAPGTATSHSLTSTLVLRGFSQPDREDCFVAFKAGVLRRATCGWCLVQALVIVEMVLRSFLSGAGNYCWSMVGTFVPYAVQAWALSRGHVKHMEALNVAMTATRYAIGALWASGVVAPPPDLVDIYLSPLLLVLELGLFTPFEQVCGSQHLVYVSYVSYSVHSCIFLEMEIISTILSVSSSSLYLR